MLSTQDLPNFNCFVCFFNRFLWKLDVLMEEMVEEKVHFLRLMKKSTQQKCLVQLQISPRGQIIIRVHEICTNARFYNLLSWYPNLSEIQNFLLWVMICRWQSKQWHSLHKLFNIVQIRSCIIFRFVQISILKIADTLSWK